MDEDKTAKPPVGSDGDKIPRTPVKQATTAGATTSALTQTLLANITKEREERDERAAEREHAKIQLELETAKTQTLEKQMELLRTLQENPQAGQILLNAVNDTPNALRVDEGVEGVIQHSPKDVQTHVQAMRSAMADVKFDRTNIGNWLTCFENTAFDLLVPEDLHGTALLQVIKKYLPQISTTLDKEHRNDYIEVQKHILDQLQITTQDLRSLLDSCQRRSNENWKCFKVRYETFYNQYKIARNAIPDEKTKKLDIADAMKRLLTGNAASYIHGREKTAEHWFSPDELAGELQEFETLYKIPADYRNFNRTQGYHWAPRPRYSGGPGNSNNRGFEQNPRNYNQSAYQRPANRNNGYNNHSNSNQRQHNSPPQHGPQANNNNNVTARPNRGGNAPNTKLPLTTRVVRMIQRADNVSPPFNSTLRCGGNSFDALLDTGTEISILPESKVPLHIREHTDTQTELACAFAHTHGNISVNLCKIPVSLDDGGKITETVELLCAITELPGDVALISLEDWETLEKLQPKHLHVKRPKRKDSDDDDKNKKQAKIRMVNVVKITQTSRNAPVTRSQTKLEKEATMAQTTVDEEMKSHSYQIDPGKEHLDKEMQSAQIRSQQQNDKTLTVCHQDATKGKNNFTYIPGKILMRTDKINDCKVEQLVVPESRRQDILRFAHDSNYGGHLGLTKTKQRIKYSFWWPGINEEIKEYIKSCEECQLRRIKKATDRVPIEPLARPQYPFQVINIDVISMDPPSSSGHKYVLVIVDYATRWIEAIPLKTLTAKETVNALIKLFGDHGIPEVICSDNGTNFTSALTNTFYQLMGIKPRFSTPEHPASNGLVERANQTLKNMLFHIVRKHGRKWDKLLPLATWAMRDVPNETTGIPPVTLKTGQPPRGPLHILKLGMLGEIEPTFTMGKKDTEFLEELRENLRKASEAAEEQFAKKSAHYAENYNKTTKPKSFSVGDEVIVFVTGIRPKMTNRWEGPAVIIEQVRDNSYKVQFTDERVLDIHADRLRPFVRRCAAIALIDDTAEEFGDIVHAPITGNTEYLKDIDFSNLKEPQRKQIISLMREYSDLFSDIPGAVRGFQHEIKLKPGAILKKPPQYRVPERLKKQLDEQIKQLLEQGLISECRAEFTCPVVLAPKKDGSIRMCVDYRALNKGIEGDAYPMRHTQDLLTRMAQAKYISCFDLRQGYYQIELTPECRKLTAFNTGSGIYQFNRLPFGVKDAPAAFQRFADDVLANMPFTMAYLDDFAVISPTWQDHLIQIRKLFNKARETNITFHAKKCQLGLGEVKYLGHIAGSGQIKPDPEKLTAIMGIKTPTNKKQVRALLGLCGFYRPFLANFATIVKPITKLTKKDVPNKIPWTKEAEKALEALKKGLCEAAALTAPNFEKQFHMSTDASDEAIGACLSQKDEQGILRPIAFASAQLTPTQRNWATIEREAYAIIWALNKWDSWLWGTEIQLETDHNPLVYLRNCTPTNSKLVRWALAIERYNVQVQHKKGALNINADALSRLPNTCWEARTH